MNTIEYSELHNLNIHHVLIRVLLERSQSLWSCQSASMERWSWSPEPTRHRRSVVNAGWEDGEVGEVHGRDVLQGLVNG